jgi:hypothetical protein
VDTHIRVLGVLYIACSAIGVILAVLVLIGLGGVAGIVGASADPEDAAVAVPILGIVGTAVVGLLLALSLPGIITGIGLFYFKSWARIAGIVLAALSLLGFPWLTILGIYGLWVLLSKDTERLFSPASP